MKIFSHTKKFNSYVIPKSITYHIIINKVIVIMIFSFLSFFCHSWLVLSLLNKYGLFQRVASRKPLLTKKNMAAQVRFAKLHLSKLQDFCRCLAIVHSTMFGETETHHSRANTS